MQRLLNKKVRVKNFCAIVMKLFIVPHLSAIIMYDGEWVFVPHLSASSTGMLVPFLGHSYGVDDSEWFLVTHLSAMIMDDGE